MENRKPPEIPEVQFYFANDDERTPAEREQELKELLAKRDALMLEMGLLPPDRTHEYWHKHKEDESASSK